MTQKPISQKIDSISLRQLAETIGGTLQGDGATTITGLASIAQASPSEVAFLANDKYKAQVAETKAAAVIVGEDFSGDGPALIRCKDAYFAYRQAMVLFYGFRDAPFTGVSDQASVDPTATLGADVSVGPFATVCAGASIGAGTVIYPGAFVGPDCLVGENCILHPNATLYDRTILGRRVIVHASASIGVDGFGYATHPDETGEVVHQPIPPVGQVILEDDVEIGSCCAIQRATMGATIIGAGTKFADLIAIGHGTTLGKHCLLVSQAGIAGSTEVGNYCVFAGQAGIVGHIRLGDGVRVGAQAGVTNDIPAGVEVLGSPAIPRADARRTVVSMFKLPDLLKDFKALKKEVAQLKKQLDDK